MNTVIVFTSKPLKTMIIEGGSGYWSANKKRIEKCEYIIATKSNTLRGRFPSDIEISKGSAFLIGKISSIVEKENKRLLIQFSEYSEIDINDSWTGNRNPVAYTDIELFSKENGLDISKLEWTKFPFNEVKPEENIKPLMIDEAKKGIAKTLGIEASCIEIQIKV
jgi:hypothetical protein